MTLKETILVLKSYKRKEETRAKETLLKNYNEASLIADFVGRILNGKHLPSVTEVYPQLAEDLTPEKLAKQQEKAEVERYKMQWMNLMYNHNAQRKNKGGATPE